MSETQVCENTFSLMYRSKAYNSIIRISASYEPTLTKNATKRKGTFPGGSDTTSNSKTPFLHLIRSYNVGRIT